MSKDVSSWRSGGITELFHVSFSLRIQCDDTTNIYYILHCTASTCPANTPCPAGPPCTVLPPVGPALEVIAAIL